MGNIYLTIGRVIVWAFIFGVACLVYGYVHKGVIFRKPEAQFSPFPCPYCGEKILQSNSNDPGDCFCPACRRTVIHGRRETKKEMTWISREESDSAAVRKYLNRDELYERIVSVMREPDAVRCTVSVKGDMVNLSLETGKTDPAHPGETEAGSVDLAPIPLDYRIETEAGREVFYRALIAYVQRNYYEKWSAQINTDHLYVEIARN